jgi:phosphate uptake regulator
MDAQALKQAIDGIESAADKAMDALKNGQVDAKLQQAVKDLHQQARTKRELNDQAALTQAVKDIEQTADRAMEACRNAGQVDPALKQAVQDVHEKASQLKHSVAGEAA